MRVVDCAFSVVVVVAVSAVAVVAEAIVVFVRAGFAASEFAVVVVSHFFNLRPLQERNNSGSFTFTT
jgi:hypothetical protein